ncbi:MAG: PAS domain S-box protein, partial [Calditrichaeota bacterium]|nr:PAS domain S-box protein [Calditrichota bacterium]
DLNGNFTSFNQKCLNVFPCHGKRKMLGKSFKKILSKDMHERSLKAFQTILFERTNVTLQDIYVLDEKGEKVFMEINASLLKEKGKVIGVLCVARDVTAVREMQSREQEYQMRMIETKKLASLGNLVQGIAHNLNTPLGTIMGRAELLQMKHPDLNELEIILEQADVMNEIISNLAQKAKRENITERAFWDVNTIIRDELKFFQADNTYKHKIKKVTKLEADLPKISIVYTHFTQAFESFIQNAIDAMIDSERKILEIRTSIKDKHIYIDICDTGIGIPKENIERLFDPFFTTKSPINDKTDKQTGLGLGLYNAYLLLQPYGIEFNVKSTKKNTCFTWIIPVESAKNKE